MAKADREGPISVKVTVGTDGRTLVDFGQPVAYLNMSPAELVRFIALLQRGIPEPISKTVN